MPLTDALKKTAHDAVAAWPADVPERPATLATVDAAKVPVPDKLAIYDGPLGITSLGLYSVQMPWSIPGGDFGPLVSQISVPASVAGTLVWDVTTGVVPGVESQFVLHGTATVIFNARESGNGPTLVVDYVDGTSALVPVSNDAEANPSTAYSMGTRTTFQVAPGVNVYLRFPAVVKAIRKATLVITVNHGYYAGPIGVYQFTYLAPRLAGSFTLKGDPGNFIETEAFEDVPPYLKNQIYGIGADPLHQRDAVDAPGGGRALRLTFLTTLSNLLSATVVLPGAQEANEVACEFDVRFDPSMLVGQNDAIKLFGGFRSFTKNDDQYFAATYGLPVGRCGILLAGNGGDPDFIGDRGWSVRSEAYAPFGSGHPMANHFMHGTYTYWPKAPAPDFYREMQPWAGADRSASLVDEWATLALRCKINDLGQTNAEVDGYFNGAHAFAKRNFFLRSTDKPLISLPPYNVPGATGRIGSVWLATYHGGQPRPTANCWFYVRNFRAKVIS